MEGQGVEQSNQSIRVGISIEGLEGCPVASTAEETGGSITEVSRAIGASDSDEVIEEFTLADSESEPSGTTMNEVFSFDSHSVYRFSRERGHGCLCELIEVFDCPVSEIKARNGRLLVSFYAPDLDTLQDIMDRLREQFDHVRIQQLSQSDELAEQDLVYIDRSHLTDRQLEVLKTAYEMGYFAQPKGANASEVAEALDIAPSTFSEHLAAAQRKILEPFLNT